MSRQLIELILSRRSIRQFTGEEISSEAIDQILAAGFAAPSGKNFRPWHFVTIGKPETLKRMAAAHPWGKMLETAAAAIVVCGEVQGSQTDKHFWVLDGAAATQNMLLAAHALGLGGVWLGVWARKAREDDLREILGIPAEIGILSSIAIGYPDEKKPAHRGLMPGRVHLEKW